MSTSSSPSTSSNNSNGNMIDHKNVPVVGGFFLPKRQTFRALVVIGVLLSSIIANNWLEAGSKWTLHLFSFACFYGCTVWVTFVSGIVMFKNLPRHMFGNLQSKLFPRYFQFCGLTIGACLTLLSTSDALPKTQLWNLVLVLANIIVNYFYLEPKTTALMFKRHVVERRIGTGKEIGVLKPDPSLLVGKDEDAALLSQMSKEFGKLHGISATMNLVALCLGTWHLSWLGSKLNME